MKILTVRQPWASMIASGRKTVEVRSWRTQYRGELLVHSGRYACGDVRARALPRGVTLCVVELTDCVPYTHTAHGIAACVGSHAMCGPQWAWLLTNVRQVRQIGMHGQQGLWDAPTSLLARLGIRFTTLVNTQRQYI